MLQLHAVRHKGFVRIGTVGARIARTTVVLNASPRIGSRVPESGGVSRAESKPGRNVILILSSDAVAAALLGALVETLGYLVRFYRPPESPDAALRRVRPHVSLVDCADPAVMNDEVLGRARMRGVSVLIFGTAEALARLHEVAREHSLGTIMLPVSADALGKTLRDAVREAC